MIGKIASTILIADDNDRDHQIISETFSSLAPDAVLQRVDSGESCLHYLANSARPRLLLLDLNMPGLDGRDVLSELYNSGEWWTLPIIVLTSSANPRDIEFCYRHGANSFHLKPLKLADFRQTIRQLAEYWLQHTLLPDTDGHTHTS